MDREQLILLFSIFTNAIMKRMIYKKICISETKKIIYS